MNLSTLNPKPDPKADAEADRLAELADRVADLRRAVDKGTQTEVFGAISDVLVASHLANINSEIDDVLMDGLAMIHGECEDCATYSHLKRLALLHVVSCVENLVELAGES